MKAALLAALLLTAGGAAAQPAATTPSCSLLGQVATTAWLQFAGAAGQGEPAALESAAALFDRMTASYDRLGCDMAALSGVFDCILTGVGEDGARAAARRCLVASDLTGP